MKKILALTVALSIAMPALAGPNPQLALSVSHRLEFYGIRVAPETLTTAQAAALHLLMTGRDPYLKTRAKARAILRNPDFRD